MFTLVVLCLSFSAADMAEDPRVLPLFAMLLRESRYGFGPERAAFVIRVEDNALVLLPWPEGAFDSAQWQGAIPRNAVAIVHTHPGSMPMPSRIDRATSRVTGLPVYVLTRCHISKALAGVGFNVVSREWVLH